MVSEADEAAGLSPGNEENEADRCFSPEKPRLPLSIVGNILMLFSVSRLKIRKIKTALLRSRCSKAVA